MTRNNKQKILSWVKKDILDSVEDLEEIYMYINGQGHTAKQVLEEIKNINGKVTSVIFEREKYMNMRQLSENKKSIYG